jgi:sugar lactone lactonase YvrE
MKQTILTLILFTCCAMPALRAQNGMAIGDWRSYLPYPFANWVAQSQDKVYFASEWSLAVMDKNDLSFQRISKVEGLSQVGISNVQFNRLSNTLIVVYDNSVIDLVRPDGIVTLFDIANFSGITGDKEIYHICIEDADKVLISTNYGISQLNLTAGNFPFTTFTGLPVLASAVFQDHIYISTEEGLFRIPRNSNFPEDFNQWEKMDQAEGFPDIYTSTALATYKDQLYFSLDDTLFRYDGANRIKVHYEPDQYIRFLTAEGPRLLAGFYCKQETCGGKALFFQADDSFEPAAWNCVDRPIYGIEDDQGNAYFADAWREFRFQEAGRAECNRIALNAPYSHNINQMTLNGDELWIASGGVRTNYSYIFREDGFFSYNDGKWSVYNRNNRSELKGLFDFYDVVVHPENGKIYVGSFLDGLVEFDRENMIVYNDTNSTLNNAALDTSRTRVSGLAFDQENNLWLANHSAERPISVFRNDGAWESYSTPSCNQNELLQVIVDRNNFKWFVVGSTSAGILIFDEGDPADPADNQCRLLSTNNSNLPSNRVNCLAMDLDGDVWVGTEQGVVVFECGANAFDPTICTGSLRTVLQDNFGAYLLETENVRTIAVDGANRKWFGTDNGIFVQSPDGTEQEAYYTVDNSPLFDNTINDIVIHPVTGEVFIGTNKGLQSIRGRATEGGVINSGEVKVFPNPVRPEYDGLIAINGLARDADVKITDIQGKLVYATRAEGGQVVWDGRDYNGRKAASGVYLVFSTSPQSLANPNAVVAKILFMN